MSRSFNYTEPGRGRRDAIHGYGLGALLVPSFPWPWDIKHRRTALHARNQPPCCHRTEEELLPGSRVNPS